VPGHRPDSDGRLLASRLHQVALAADEVIVSLTSITTYPRRLAHRRLAGKRARGRYAELRSACLRSNRREFAALALALVGLGVAATVYDELWFGHIGFISGVAWGASFSVWVALRNSPPSFVENWQRGAWGEEFTADELAKLPKAEWDPIHDLPDRNGNIDHVVLGPAGIFLLDSKKYSGTVQVVGDDLVMTNEGNATRPFTDRGRLACTRAQAARFNGELRKRTGQSPWVEPAIVVWGDFPARIHRGKGVTVVHGSELVGWLNGRPRKGGNAREFAEHIRGGRHRRAA
jgi:hypothetical protein